MDEVKDLGKIWIWFVIAGILMLFSQWQINVLASNLVTGSVISFSKSANLDDANIADIKSTAQAIATLFPIDDMKTTQDIIDIMIPAGTPEYGNLMGVSFDDPIGSMNKMERAYPALKKSAQENPEIWQRYLSLAASPRGISCEFCCGVGAQGVDAKGNLRCGCSHNPALQTVALWLLQNTDYSDAEVLKEVMKWKTLWFPKNMVNLASQIAGGDTSVLEDLPGMVGGC